MRQKITLITLGVRDFQKALHFYEEGLAEDATVEDKETGFSGITISHNTHSEKEVDEVLKEVKRLGATIVKPAQKVFWGGYSGYFKDIDGHFIEVAFNPFWGLDKNDNLLLP